MCTRGTTERGNMGQCVESVSGHTVWGKIHRNQPKHQNLQFEAKKCIHQIWSTSMAASLSSPNSRSITSKRTKPCKEAVGIMGSPWHTSGISGYAWEVCLGLRKYCVFLKIGWAWYPKTSSEKYVSTLLPGSYWKNKGNHIFVIAVHLPYDCIYRIHISWTFRIGNTLQ